MYLESSSLPTGGQLPTALLSPMKKYVFASSEESALRLLSTFHRSTYFLHQFHGSLTVQIVFSSKKYDLSNNILLRQKQRSLIIGI
jgi:hypothetical protein